MKPMDLVKAIGNAKDSDIINAHKPISVHKNHRLVLIAAIVALMAILVGCTTAYLLHLRNLHLGDQTAVEPEFKHTIIENTSATGENKEITIIEGPYQGEKEVTQKVFSMSTWINSPEYQAAQEWFKFNRDFDSDKSIYYAYRDKWQAENGGDESYFMFPSEYEYYGVYDQAMIDEIDRITQKYDLNLITEMKHQWYEFLVEGTDRLTQYTGVENFIRPETGASIACVDSARISKELYFCMNYDLKMPWEEQVWPVLCTMTYIPRGVFSTDHFTLNSDEAWQEENYTTTYGDNVLIVKADEGVFSWIVCERADAVITLRVESRMDVMYEDENGTDYADAVFMTMDQLHQVADAFDFTFQLNPDWDYVEKENVFWLQKTKEATIN